VRSEFPEAVGVLTDEVMVEYGSRRGVLGFKKLPIERLEQREITIHPYLQKAGRRAPCRGPPRRLCAEILKPQDSCFGQLTIFPTSSRATLSFPSI
jgi:hypothetical protein